MPIQVAYLETVAGRRCRIPCSSGLSEDVSRCYEGIVAYLQSPTGLFGLFPLVLEYLPHLGSLTGSA